MKHSLKSSFLSKASFLTACLLAGSSLCLADNASMIRLLDRRPPRKPPSLAEKKQEGIPVTTIVGRVVGIQDGDTLTVLDAAQRQHTIRLSDIDAPEIGRGKGRPGQPFAQKAKDYLASMVAGQVVVNECHDVDLRDRNGQVKVRHVCHVWLGTQNINAAMLRAGMALANRQHPSYVRDPQSFELEHQAKAAGRGLWADAQIVPPWQWRRSSNKATIESP